MADTSTTTFKPDVSINDFDRSGGETLAQQPAGSPLNR
jgi:hypothetical protein